MVAVLCGGLSRMLFLSGVVVDDVRARLLEDFGLLLSLCQHIGYMVAMWQMAACAVGVGRSWL